MRKGRGTVPNKSNPAPFTERSIVNKHDHKKPPLQYLLHHIIKQRINIAYYASMVCLALLFGYIIAGVFD